MKPVFIKTKQRGNLKIVMSRDKFHAYNIFLGEFMKVHAYGDYGSEAERIKKTKALHK